MTGCTLCPRQCGKDRSKEPGACGVGDDLKVGSIVIHRGEEPPLVTGSGSGAVFFSGCPLKCVFCQNKQIRHDALGTTITMDGSGAVPAPAPGARVREHQSGEPDSLRIPDNRGGQNAPRSLGFPCP
jgi:uncharacterized Fe-S radical SAM superfamily protein PflX